MEKGLVFQDKSALKSYEDLVREDHAQNWKFLLDAIAEYFPYASDRLRRIKQPQMEYRIPGIEEREVRTPEDLARIIRISSNPAAMMLLEHIKGESDLLKLPRMAENIERDEYYAFLRSLNKLPPHIFGLYDGAKIVIQLKRGIHVYAHELNHVFRHQTIGAFEKPSTPVMNGKANPWAGGRVPEYVCEFFGELDSIIGFQARRTAEARLIPDYTPSPSDLALLKSLQYTETSDGFNKAVEYFAGGYFSKSRAVLREVAGQLLDLEKTAPTPSEIDPGQIKTLEYEFRKGVKTAEGTIKTFNLMSAYIPLLEDAVTFPVESSMQMYEVMLSLLGVHFISPSETDTYKIAVMGQMREYLLAANQATASFRANLDHWVEQQSALYMPRDPDVRTSYVLADMAITRRIEELERDWPTAFHMPARLVRDTYFDDVIGNVKKARKLYADSKIEAQGLVTAANLSAKA